MYVMYMYMRMFVIVCVCFESVLLGSIFFYKTRCVYSIHYLSLSEVISTRINKTTLLIRVAQYGVIKDFKMFSRNFNDDAFMTA